MPRFTYITDLNSVRIMRSYKILFIVSKADIQIHRCLTRSRYWHWQVTWNQELAYSNDLGKSLKFNKKYFKFFRCIILCKYYSNENACSNNVDEYHVKQMFLSLISPVYYLWTNLQLNKVFSKKYANITIECDEKAWKLSVHSKP